MDRFAMRVNAAKQTVAQTGELRRAMRRFVAQAGTQQETVARGKRVRCGQTGKRSGICRV